RDLQAAGGHRLQPARQDHWSAGRPRTGARPASACGNQTMSLFDIFIKLVEILVIFVGIVLIAALLIWVERRMLGLWQDRYGPNRAGPFGILQVVADMIKIFFKEDWIPPFVDKTVFVVAPGIIMVTSRASFAVIPFSANFGIT